MRSNTGLAGLNFTIVSVELKLSFATMNEEHRFLIFKILQFAIDGKNNSKTKVEKVFFFIFMSSYAEMSFLK
jgi:hypothetical protein